MMAEGQIIAGHFQERADTMETDPMDRVLTEATIESLNDL
jgi:hypothetical protein